MPLQQKTNSFQEKLKTLTLLLSTPKKIVITMHKNPDGDALGSAVALAKFLQKKNHHVWVISPNSYPNYLAWMTDYHEVFIYEEGNQSILDKYVQKADVIFCLDFSNLSRISAMGAIVQNTQATKVIIDHHTNPENFANICICEPHASSTTLLLYNIIVALGEESLIDATIATCLYTGILTDTGFFQNSATYPETHRVVANLLEKGIDIDHVNKKMHSDGSMNKLKFIGHALLNKLEIMPHLHTAYFAISKKDYQKYNLEPGDTQMLTNYPLTIKDIAYAVLFTERNDDIRVSFRSLGNFAVNEIAQELFNGGGHKNAAGAISKLSLSETIHKVIDKLSTKNHIK